MWIIIEGVDVEFVDEIPMEMFLSFEWDDGCTYIKVELS